MEITTKYYRRNDGLRYLQLTSRSAGLQMEWSEGRMCETVTNWGSEAIMKERLLQYTEITSEAYDEAKRREKLLV